MDKKTLSKNAILKAFPDLIFLLNDKGEFLSYYADNSNESKLYLPPKEFLGKNVKKVLPEYLAKLTLTKMKEIFLGKNLLFYEYHLDIKGERHYYEARMVRHGENEVLVIVRDITKRKEYERELQAYKDVLEVILNSISEAIIALNMDNQICHFNVMASRFLSIHRLEAKEKNIFDILKLEFESSQLDLYQLIELIKSGKEEKIFIKEAILNNNSNNRVFVSLTITPLKDVNNQITGVVLVIRDIEQLLALEKEKLKAKNLESLSVLAGGIAHDFNNILTGIFGNIELAMFSLPKDSQIYKYLSIAYQSLERAAALSNRLLTFAKGGEPILEGINLAELVSEVSDFNLSGTKIKPVYQFEDNLWKVKADKGQLAQVIANLVINAREAMEGKSGRLYLRAKNFVCDGKKILPLTKGKYICLEIEDEGCGIPEDNIDRIFEPYFTTKETGNGLGLSIVYSIIQRHGGYIEISSKLNKGTKFTVYLPAYDKFDFKKDKNINTEEEKILHNKIVLLIDDEEAVREVAREMLELLGLEIIEVDNGEKGLEIYKKSLEEGKVIDLVIVDLTIPGGMGGEVFIKEIRKIDKNVKVVVTSGYTDSDLLTNYANYGFSGKLVKPFQLQNLKQELLKTFKKV